MSAQLLGTKNDNILPDSRLVAPKNTEMVDFKLPNGSTLRLEVEPIFCANCGKPQGGVPVGLMTSVFALCQPCSEVHGANLNGWVTTDEQFWAAVAMEMEIKYGHILSQAELDATAEIGGLSRPLQLLDAESPYRKMQPASPASMEERVKMYEADELRKQTASPEIRRD